MATNQIDTVSDVDLAQCEAEPIRIPGAIQPHGWLFAFETRSFELQHVSANVSDLLDRSAADILGRPLFDWLEPADALVFATALEPPPALDIGEPLAPLALRGVLYDATVHRVGTLVILELERAVSPVDRNDHLLARAIRRLQSADALPALHEVTVREVRELTGCDRVVVYAFGNDGSGRVLAEAKAEDMPSYLRLQFPASDIPAQARELYRQNWLRMIPDVDYRPVPIVGLHSAGSGAPIDLTHSLLRSVSPIHCEYMRNMDVHSSISISLLRGGELWGLISCGHRAPKHIPRRVRTACLAIGQLLSLQISAFEGLQEAALVKHTEPLLAPLIEQMQLSTQAVLDSLAGTPEQLLRLTEATGAAIISGDQVTLLGACPTEQHVMALARWAAEQAGAAGYFSTAELPLVYEPAKDFANMASGLLMVVLPKPVPNMLLWLRPEVETTVAWAGEPGKLSTSGADDTPVRLSPRSSFESWKVLVRHHSAEWMPHHIHAARELRRSAIEFDLAAQVIRAQEAVASRDELVAVVSHDLCSPLTVVALGAALLVRTLVTDTNGSSRRLLVAAQSIQRATTRMNEMLRDLLDLARIEQGRYHVQLAAHSVDELFEDARALLAPIAESRRIALNFSFDEGVMVQADPERVYQVIANLVGNALKFTSAAGRVDVVAAIDPGSNGALVRFSVQDSGTGMSDDEISHIFERYWRGREASPTGTGLGLYIARGVVEAHGGSIWAESQLGVGSTFHFTLIHAGSGATISLGQNAVIEQQAAHVHGAAAGNAHGSNGSKRLES